MGRGWGCDMLRSWRGGDSGAGFLFVGWRRVLRCWSRALKFLSAYPMTAWVARKASISAIPALPSVSSGCVVSASAVW